jgi:hypothetical protein
MAKQTMNHQETKETHGDPDTGLDLGEIFTLTTFHFSVTFNPFKAFYIVKMEMKKPSG